MVEKIGQTNRNAFRLTLGLFKMFTTTAGKDKTKKRSRRLQTTQERRQEWAKWGQMQTNCKQGHRLHIAPHKDVCFHSPISFRLIVYVRVMEHDCHNKFMADVDVTTKRRRSRMSKTKDSLYFIKST